ncbi:putative RNA methyltransferase [Propionimicrobium sp. PCR01-08-3]|uniref:putative RNA methyltransferase n=1 Tax=Propionimicrobium sp. PCR01-08-3 TaxID=3052086 RepID=UPI00255CAFB2|nr:SAM-dependent methyltransferase [Propionimicrobium sp. PCR01-08-3]WIY81605.1 SAM-dependent methyltransferase [Propionimicrobium sp. PCR01-08-3]
MPAIDAALGLLICPICSQPMSRVERRLHCPAQHSFDLAKQGYVNLLNRAAPANADSARMADARDRFLSAGYYEPICDAVVRASAGAEAAIAEVGAGTGYYLGAVVSELSPGSHLAMDISVAAMKRAARRGLACVVADTWQRLPIAEGCLDRLLCIFAPRNPAEFHRVLADGGRVIVVTPLSDHLRELRNRFELLGVEDNKLARLDESFDATGLELSSREELRFSITLDPAATTDLISMGPNAFHQHDQNYSESLSTRIAVAVSTYRKRHRE